MAQPIYLDPELQGIERQRQLAQALQQRGMQTPQGRMVSGRYVAPSFTEYLASAFDVYGGKKGVEEAEKGMAAYQQKQQKTAQQNIADALRLSRGGEETVYGAGMEGPTMEVKQVAPDTNAAIAQLLRPNATAMETNLGGKLLERQFDKPKWEKAELPMPDGSVKQGWVDYNSPNPKNTFVEGGTKPSLSQKEILEFRDKGINVGGGGAMPTSAMPTSAMPMAGSQGNVQNNQSYNPNLSPEKNRELNFAKAKLQAEYADKAPAAIEMMNQTLLNVNDLIGDTKVVDGKVVFGKKPPLKGFAESVGFSTAPLGKFVPGTDVSNFIARFNQIKDKTFLQAFETLKGSGQITEVEGAKATSALNRMSLAQSEKEFIIAAREFEDNVQKGMVLAKQRAGIPTNSGWRMK
jgi:hypothetical protein